MKGLELTERFAWEVALPALASTLGDDADKIAAGSVGDGSDRFGFDDDISRDHDWGVSLCIWVPDDMPDLAKRVQTVISELPKDYCGFPVLGFGTPCPAWRAGSWTVGEHYSRFCGGPRGPLDEAEWDCIPEEALAAATNGMVYFDGDGSFTEIRNRLLSGYPRAVGLKRIVSRCRAFAQAGQVNLSRALHRGDRVGAYLAFARAHSAACLLVHILSGRFCPYYKWEHASAAQNCGDLGRSVAALFEELSASCGPLDLLDAKTAQWMVERIAICLCGGLESCGLREPSSTFLLDQAEFIETLMRAEREVEV